MRCNGSKYRNNKHSGDIGPIECRIKLQFLGVQRAGEYDAHSFLREAKSESNPDGALVEVFIDRLCDRKISRRRYDLIRGQHSRFNCFIKLLRKYFITES